MKKKSLITMLVALTLVAVVGVGATLAYLTDTTEKLTNTFTLGKVDIDLEEPSFEEDGIVEDIVPGQAIAKDPTVTVKANSVDSYVFMSVTGIDAMEEAGFVIDGINAAWAKADDTEGLDGVYVYVDAQGAPQVVAKADTDNVLAPLFEEVTYLSTNTENEGGTFQILVKAAAVQASGEEGYTFENALAAVIDDLTDFAE